MAVVKMSRYPRILTVPQMLGTTPHLPILSLDMLGRLWRLAKVFDKRKRGRLPLEKGP